MWTGVGGQKPDFCGRHKWMAHAVYIGFSSTNSYKLQAVLNDAVRLIWAAQSSPISLLSSEKIPSLFSCSPAHPIQDLLPHEKLSYWICSTNTSKPTVSQYRLYLIVIVNVRFLQRPQKRNRGNQLIHRRLTKIDRQRVKIQSGRQTVRRYGGWC